MQVRTENIQESELLLVIKDLGLETCAFIPFQQLQCVLHDIIFDLENALVRDELHGLEPTSRRNTHNGCILEL
jgi:hypothetical protein